MPTIQPRKSRRTLANLPVHLARRQLSAHLADDLIKRYDRRTTTVRVGDTVRVMRGEFRGTTGKVLAVDRKDRKIHVEGVTLQTAKKSTKPRPVDASNVLLVKLDLTDKLRRDKLGEKEAPSEEEVAAAKAAKKTQKEKKEEAPDEAASAKEE